MIVKNYVDWCQKKTNHTINCVVRWRKSFAVVLFLLNHQLYHLNDPLLGIEWQGLKLFGELIRLVLRRMVNHITEDCIRLNLKCIEQGDQFFAAWEGGPALKGRNVVCCKAGLFGKLFLRQSKTLTALLYSLAYSIIDHDTYHVPFHVFHNKYMD